MTSFALKLLACISMFVDHMAHILPDNSFSFYLNLFGRLAFPIFAFQLTVGYIHTKNLKKYFIRLFILALISQIPFNLYFDNFPELNIFFTLFLGLIAIHIYSTLKTKSLSILLVCIIAYIAELLDTDYGWFGVLLIFSFYVFKDYKFILASIFTLLTFAFYIIRSNIINERLMVICICTIAALVPIFLYNKKQGKKFKYLFYAFYPAHLFVLYFIKLLL